jgi:hypothetical protein
MHYGPLLVQQRERQAEARRGGVEEAANGPNEALRAEIGWAESPAPRRSWTRCVGMIRICHHSSGACSAGARCRCRRRCRFACGLSRAAAAPLQ